MKLAADNGWGILPTSTNGIWNASLTAAANTNGLFAKTMELAATPTHFPTMMAARNPRTATAQRSYLKKGCRLRHNTNQKPPGHVKVHHDRRTFQRANGNITMTHIQVQRRLDNTRDCDNIYLPAMNRPTDLIRHAEYMATAMDNVPVVIAGNHFHHSTVLAALEQHATTSQSLVADAIAQHDGHNSANAVGYTDP